MALTHMVKSKKNSTLFRQIALVEKEIETLRAKEKNKLFSESLELMRLEMHFAKNKLSHIPKKEWIRTTKNGLTFIPLVLQTNKIIQDTLATITILKSRSDPSVKKIEPCNKIDEFHDEGMQALITLLKSKNEGAGGGKHAFVCLANNPGPPQ